MINALEAAAKSTNNKIHAINQSASQIEDYLKTRITNAINKGYFNVKMRVDRYKFYTDAIKIVRQKLHSFGYKTSISNYQTASFLIVSWDQQSV